MKTETHKNLLSEINLKDNWEFPERKNNYTFNEDDVIDAYLKGKEDGINSNFKALIKVLNENVQTTIMHRNELNNYLLKKSIQPVYAFLKIISVNMFELLTLIPSDKLIDEKFFEVYDFVTDYESKINNEYYKLTFSFTKTGESFDFNALESDGFYLKYEYNKSDK
ncbi:MAG: hypothetical protein IAE65_05920 [Ignavibacteria bacterium]|nr:hypothetical protein [Ignavibacteria bacterium]